MTALEIAANAVTAALTTTLLAAADTPWLDVSGTLAARLDRLAMRSA